jgi:hypothetical protein
MSASDVTPVSGSGTRAGAGRVRVAMPDEASLRAAIERLEQASLPARVVEMQSSVPLSEDLAELAPTRRSRAHVWGISGGIAGGLAGWLLALFTAKAYPIVTGHMPIVAAPTSGIVVYEGIALGAVLATTFCVLWEGGLLRRRRERAAEDRAPAASGAIVLTIEADDAAARDRALQLLEFPTTTRRTP